MKCAFTGHRTIDAEFDGDLFDRSIENLITVRKVDTFFNGMARGFDLLAAQKIIEMRRKYAIKLVACIPFGGQIDSLSMGDRSVYARVLEQCDDIRVLAAEYYPGCMYARNRYMVDNADIVYAHFHGGSKGGTYYTVSYAKKSGKPLFLI